MPTKFLVVVFGGGAEGGGVGVLNAQSDSTHPAQARRTAPAKKMDLTFNIVPQV